VIAPLRYAQQLTGHPGRVSRIFVRPLPAWRTCNGQQRTT
jgi:hypothetical protein